MATKTTTPSRNTSTPKATPTARTRRSKKVDASLAQSGAAALTPLALEQAQVDAEVTAAENAAYGRPELHVAAAEPYGNPGEPVAEPTVPDVSEDYPGQRITGLETAPEPPRAAAAPDTSTIEEPAPAAPLTILSADYGVGDELGDVTAKVQGLVVDGRLDIKVTNKVLGFGTFKGVQVRDPAWNKFKRLRVTYRIGDGEPITAECWERVGRLTIPPPEAAAVEATETGTEPQQTSA